MVIKSTLPRDVKLHSYPGIWDPYYHVNTLLRKTYEKCIKENLFKNNYQILDYGCGIMPYKHLFENKSLKYIGADLEGNKIANVIFKKSERLPFENNTFDIVISSQVLEHVDNTDFYLKESYRLLKEGGILLLSTHGTWQYHASPNDYYRWTRKGLEFLLTNYGFKVKKIYPILGQLALTSQLRLTFYNSFANKLGLIGRLLLTPISIMYQFKMIIEDFITPERVKQRDSAIYLTFSEK